MNIKAIAAALAMLPGIVLAGPSVKQRGNFVIIDSVRIELLSPSMFAVTESPRPSFKPLPNDLAVVSRPSGKVSHTVRSTDGKVFITTDAVTITVDPSCPLLAGGVSVSSGDATLARLAEPDTTNLGGVVGALDNCDGETNYSEQNDVTSSSRHLPVPMDGVLSRRGFTVLNHSGDYLTRYNPGSAFNELLVLSYGNDYRRALTDFYSVAGSPSMLPKWSLGFIYSRWKDYTDEDYHRILEGFRSRNIPIDAIILDMCWHVDHWYGYKYDTANFPDMRGFLDWAEKEGLKVGFNHHSGCIYKDDPKIHDFCKAAGLDYEKSIVAGPSFEPEIRVVEYDTRNERHFKAFYDLYLDHMIADGFDFHWVDGANSIYSAELYNRYLREQTGKRPFVLNRQQQSVLCNHRYPAAFSGDTYATWATMRHTLATTIKGANNGVNWSHDIGGYMPQGYDGYLPDGEMFARWVQFGAFSPIMRFHAKKDLFWHPAVKHPGDYDGGSRLPWDWGPTVEKSITQFINLRASLIPYIYTAMYRCHTEGEPICRGMYIDWPSADEAYNYDQFMFGDNFLVAPVMVPSGYGQRGTVERTLWLPEGLWYDYFTGVPVNGGGTVKREADLYSMPVYVKGGAIIPTVRVGRNVSEPTDSMTLTIYTPASAGTSSYELYDDAGDSYGFEKGEKTLTRIDYAYTPRSGHDIMINKVVGSYPGMPSSRNYTLALVGTERPAAVLVNGARVSDWKWEDGRLTISGCKADTAADFKVEVKMN